MSLLALKDRIAGVNDLLCTLNLLVWDSRTMMPSGGTASRGCQIATVTRLARDTLMDAATLSALDGAEREIEALPQGSDDREAVRQIRAAIETHKRIPADLIERRASVRAMANAAWIAARAASDYSLFKPYLAETVKNTRDYADAIGWTEHPYDALLSLYEPGETLTRLRSLFSVLEAGLKPILARAMTKPRDAEALLHRSFPVDMQMQLAQGFSADFGYDFARGRLDTTVHPFEISHTRDDVRITTRCNPNFLRPALFGAFHETGHALYEQNVHPDFARTVFATDLVGLYAVGGTSFGAHESQSRLFENHVGRSRQFWALNFDRLRQGFPEALADVDAARFYEAVTTVTPGLIRTDADELTYDFHIMLRVELEAAMIGGEVDIDDIPAIWAARMKDRLGLDVPNDREGCLQDIHWSSGMIGTFCTYTIGNVMAAQLFETALQAPGGIANALERGNYAPLRAWLSDAIWQHGRRHTREELLTRATGRGLDPAPYLAYLAAKYG